MALGVVLEDGVADLEGFRGVEVVLEPSTAMAAVVLFSVSPVFRATSR